MSGVFAGGMLGRGQQAIAPSRTALGPNRYLRERDFLVMLGIAFAIHLAALVIASLMPRETVKDIPVRALSFKLGGQVPRAAPMVAAPAAVAAPPVAPSQDSWRATAVQPLPKPMPRPVPKPVKQPKIIPLEPPEKRRMPVENRAAQTLPRLPVPTLSAPVPASSMPPLAARSPHALPSTNILTQVASPAIAPSPQRFTREAGAAPAAGMAGGEGGAPGDSDTAESIRARYTQQISAWVKQHYAYPAGANGAKGRVLVRIRITREGYLRYYAVETSSGHALLDAAAVEMVKRANPMPAAPPGYTNDTLIEFRIPINFAPDL